MQRDKDNGRREEKKEDQPNDNDRELSAEKKEGLEEDEK